MTNNDSESLTALDHYYAKQEPYTRECLLALKRIIMSIDPEIATVRKYQIPFFCYKSFNLAFLWVHRKKVLVGLVEDKKTTGQRKDKVTTIEINPMEDIPVLAIKHNIESLYDKYRQL